ncbi:hypothetical protein [Paraconexibacter algicola]|uniref:Uncharacterized protein n=1 Tax=Paraconexibacter algicola TaxID=2133960 RepID=A0A2T4UCZ3_9ACTN|nr:hypothetical protein [Paraconexibacter algicola]PTL55370.1 hypothetical protein C7Y72_17050 [Paraconexibacter algicola]
MNSSSFSLASERLRSDGLAPSEEIAKVEGHLDSRTQGQPIEASEVARRLRIGEDTTTRILEGHVTCGTLYSRHHAKCPRCSTLHPLDEFRHKRDSGDDYSCTSCDADLLDPEKPSTEVAAYYLR